MDRGDLANLAAFVAVADQRSFRAAAARLGVTPSALSHSMRQLEERLAVRLLHRTTRSVSATDAGQRLLSELRPAIEQIAGALENLNKERLRPMGRLRIYATSQLVATAVVVPIWDRFLSTFPEVHLEVHVGDAPIDIVAEGYDAGIGPQDRAAADMIATRVTGPMKMALVGAPAYFARQRTPRTPDDLTRQSCIQSRLATGSPLLWELVRSGKLGGFRWMAASWSTTPLWPPARRLTGWASHTRPKPWPNRSCARGNWSECWRTGRHGLRDSSSITLGTGRYQPVCAPSST
jgi:DNA-binding transcriptional LysR family regulator